MSSFALKIIAVLSMLLDHIGVVFGEDMPVEAYYALRLAGRIAMPVFCFLIAEGLLKTADVKKYLSRLLLFAFLSELPFDLLFYNTPFYPQTQNVYFTLFLGLLGIMLFDFFAARNQRFPALLAVLACGTAAVLLRTDYDMFGIFFIFAFYYGRGNIKVLTSIFAVGVFAAALSVYIGSGPWMALISLSEILALPFIFRYNGNKGRSSPFIKWGFYFFYPAHLLALWLIINVSR